LRKFGLTAAARVSFGIYNTAEEIDLFIDAVTEAALTLNTAPTLKMGI
jgi:selenocysteine lyase/cysteine desulfurase